MDNMLAFVAKTIGTTARVGASIALGALVVAILRGMNVEPLASIDKPIYGAIVAAGILGACTVVVEFIIVFITVRLSEPGSLDNPWRAIR